VAKRAVKWCVFLVVLLALPAPAQAAFNDQPEIISVDTINVTTTDATLRGFVRWNERASDWRFVYCRESECPDGQVETPRELGAPQDDQAVETIQWTLHDLQPSTVYHVTLHAGNDTWNDYDTNESQNAATRDFTFRTADPARPAAPAATTASTGAPSGITPYAATLNGTVVPGTTGSTSVGTSAFFEWGNQGGPLDQSTPPRNLPADATPYAISAALSDLSPGQRLQYRAVAIRNGQRFAGPVVSFQTQQAPECPAGSRYQTVRNGRIIAVGCFRAAGQHWVTESFVRLNGVLFEPEGSARSGNNHQLADCDGDACQSLQSYLGSGNKFYIDRAGDAIGTTGRWKMSAGQLVGMHHGTLNIDDVEWTGDDPLVSLGADRSVDLFDFPLAGELSWTPSADGSSRLGLVVGLPVALGGVTGESAVRVNPGGDLVLDRLKIEVGEVPIRAIRLGDLSFLYDRPSDTWKGSAALTLPTPTGLTIGASVTVVNGQFNELAGYADNLNIMVAPGIFFQKVGALFGLNPVRLGGTVGFTAGPVIRGIPLIGVDGSFLVDFQGGYDATRRIDLPPSLYLSGAVNVFSVPVRQGWVRFFFTNQAWIEMGGNIGVDLKSGDFTIFHLGGDVSGALQGRFFEMSGTLGLTVLSYNVASASAILNTKGVAACGKVLNGLFAVGGYARWTGGTGTVWYCDLGRLRGQLNSKVLRSAQAGPTPLELPADDKQALVRFTGDGGAPHVRLHRPDGRVIDTPADGSQNSSDDRSFLSFRNDAENTTDVLLADTGNGHWTYELLPGSAPVRQLQGARPLPDVDVSAKVRRVGKRQELRWRLRPIDGQQVTFFEEGLGAPPRELKKTTASEGTVRFTPEVTPQRRRRIVALVEQDDLPRARKVVATYTAPRPGRVTGVRSLRARRRGTRVLVTWSKMPAAQSFRLIVVGADGSRIMRSTKRTSLTLRGALARNGKSVLVRAVDVEGKPGPQRRARVGR
jgi:hypothetical protein